MSVIVKTACILNLDELTEDCALYGNRDEETGGAEKAVAFTRDYYADLGEPSQITVTIEPGDKLNDPEPA